MISRDPTPPVQSPAVHTGSLLDLSWHHSTPPSFLGKYAMALGSPVSWVLLFNWGFSFTSSHSGHSLFRDSNPDMYWKFLWYNFTGKNTIYIFLLFLSSLMCSKETLSFGVLDISLNVGDFYHTHTHTHTHILVVSFPSRIYPSALPWWCLPLWFLPNFWFLHFQSFCLVLHQSLNSFADFSIVFLFYFMLLLQLLW